jgi:GNAT superfamily N-acetyltransferase
VIPHSGGRVWEIHPIAVRTADQSKGYGRLLVQHVERMAQSHGVLTLFAGTSDETGADVVVRDQSLRESVVGHGYRQLRRAARIQILAACGFR